MTSTTQHSNSRFYGAEFDIFDQEYPQDKHTFTVHTVHPETGDLWASTDDGEQVHIPADEIPSDIRMASTKHPELNNFGVNETREPGTMGYDGLVRYVQCAATEPRRGRCQFIGYPNELADHIENGSHRDVFGVYDGDWSLPT